MVLGKGIATLSGKELLVVRPPHAQDGNRVMVDGPRLRVFGGTHGLLRPVFLLQREEEARRHLFFLVLTYVPQVQGVLKIPFGLLCLPEGPERLHKITVLLIVKERGVEFPISRSSYLRGGVEGEGHLDITVIRKEGRIIVTILDLVLHTDGRPDHVDSGRTLSRCMIPGVRTYPGMKGAPHRKGLRGRQQRLKGRHTFCRTVWSRPLKGSWMATIEVRIQHRVKIPTYKCGAAYIHNVVYFILEVT